MLVGNCGKLTGGINLMPDAEPDDGTLDVVVIAPRGLAAWVSVAARVLAKSGRSTQTLDRYRCREIEVHVDHDQMVELDGDIIGEARHIQIEVQPRALIVRPGRAAAATPPPDRTADPEGTPGSPAIGVRNLRSRQARSKGRRHVYGEMSLVICSASPRALRVGPHGRGCRAAAGISQRRSMPDAEVNRFGRRVPRRR